MQVVTVEPPTELLTGVLVGAVVDAVDRFAPGEIDWWVFMANGVADPVAKAYGFVVDRDLLQMHRSLPAPRHADVSTRSFVVGSDEERWLAVNNRAFAGHAEQGGWTLETLRQRLVQAWFDPQGFRLHERDGRLAAFCWTKIHDSPAAGVTSASHWGTGEAAARGGDDPVGEIYVIGVDPDFQGLGLGTQLTLAGLDHMVAVGVRRAMLYVDGANAAAGALYRRLGFVVRRTDRAFRRPSIVSA
jgi:mycothiol synthase